MTAQPSSIAAMRLSSALERVRNRKVRQGVTNSTLAIFDQRSKPVLEFFDDCALEELTASWINRFQESRRSYGVSGRTINMELGVLRSVLIDTNLWNEIRRAVDFEIENKDAARVLSPEDKQRLIAVAGLKPQWFYAFTATVLAINTSCRSVEVRHLRWQDVDFEQRLLHVRITKGRTGGRRTIPLNDHCIQALQALRKRASAAKRDQPEDWLFPGFDKNRAPLKSRPANFRTAWRSLTKAAGLSGLRFHDLRHQFITELSEAGVPDPVIMSLVGHKTRQMLDTYTHVRLDAKKLAIERLAATESAAEPCTEVSATQQPCDPPESVQWAAIETSRGERLAGAVRPAIVFGGRFVRVDVPAGPETKGCTTYLRLEVIDSITPLEPGER